MDEVRLLPEEITHLTSPIILVCAADDRFAMAMAVMLYSALKNCSRPRDVEVHILDAGISSPHRRRVAGILAPFRTRLHWIDAPVARLQALSLPPPGRFSHVTYVRLLAPDLLPASLDRAIYIDADMLALGDVAPLWAREPGENYLLAVPTSSVGDAPLAGCPDPDLSVDSSAPYFNAGILLMNLVTMRRDGVGAKVLDFCKRWPEHARFPDQDGLNAVVQGRWSALDREWNTLVTRTSFRLPKQGALHFAGRGKPWNTSEPCYFEPSDRGSAHRLYERYLRESRWHGRMEYAARLSWRFGYGFVARAAGKARAVLAASPRRQGRAAST